MADLLTRFAYQTLQQSKLAMSLAHKQLSKQVRQTLSPWGLVGSTSTANSMDAALLAKIQQRLQQTLEADWQDAEAGVYPKELLFDHPWDEIVRNYPLVWFDLPQAWRRSQQGQYQEFAPSIDTTGYPQYYVQNFHHQTDGYLSDWSANLYDLQVDLLFNGTADAMRRRILAPLKQAIAAFPEVLPQQTQILDVACGTGRTLRMIRGMLPKASLHGVDLSSAYLRKANRNLSQLPGELPQLIQANAEDLPYRDRQFHAVTCVFLFHELPGPVRQKVIDQCFRVVKPGGTLIICDSIQLSDSPEFVPAMETFAATFHEPFYINYIQDNLVDRLHQAGFEQVSEQVHFMSKYLIAKKPTIAHE